MTEGQPGNLPSTARILVQLNCTNLTLQIDSQILAALAGISLNSVNDFNQF
jgi:hypothetical protein